MRADTEDEVIAVLERAGYWDDPNVWRNLGDQDNNFATIGNQQSEAVAALVEKIVNGVDARLINAALTQGVALEGPTAPESMREAVAQLIENRQSPEGRGGRLVDWVDKEATEQARLLTVAATGNMPSQGQPSITVADQGEGQTPDRFPETFMSLQRNNKLRIPFVQGKFNMGGTGALQFCGGDRKLQLVVSRRNPTLLGPDAEHRDRQWAFTVVRREPPAGGRRSSVFTYLAPVMIPGSHRKGVLSFDADEWPIFPEANDQVRDAYNRMSPYGSLIKLYEYHWQGPRSNIVFAGDGLLRRIDVGLPEIALPVRFYECRPEYKGHAGSFATNALGLVTRLDRDRADNLERESPVGGVLSLEGKRIRLRAYVFQADKAKQYRTPRQAIIFSVNGQMHGALSADFFRRKSVGMGYLADSLLVVADCTDIDGVMREDLFMNSRDRIRETPLSRKLERALEEFLKDEPTLREVQNRRRAEALSNRLTDDKPLADILEGLIKASPLLSRLLSSGMRLPAPFPNQKSGGSSSSAAGEFVGKRYPTYFRFKGRKDGESISREARLGRRVRITLETDAEDGYFVRQEDPGAWNVRRLVDGTWVDVLDEWTATDPKSGLAQVWIRELPAEMRVGDEVTYVIEVTDPTRFDAFQNVVTLTVVPDKSPGSGGGGSRGSNPNSGEGQRSGNASGLALPPITPVPRADWERHGFNDESALKIVQPSADSGVYDFYVNIDNRYLKTAQKTSVANGPLYERQFTYALVLIGLAMLNDSRRAEAEGVENTVSVEEAVLRVTRAVAPVLLPMIQSIGSLKEDD